MQYGDGLFETIAVADGNVCLWRQHISRLLAGCARLNIPPPDTELLRTEVSALIADSSDGVVKIIITRGESERGYRYASSLRPNRIVHFQEGQRTQLVPEKQDISLRFCRQRLSHNPRLAGIKHLNRLEQVIARSEWDDPDVVEGLMLDQDDNVIEGTMSNLFLQKHDRLITPSLDKCGVAGIVRNLVIQVATELQQSLEVRNVSRDDIHSADALYLTNSLLGIMRVRQLADQQWDPAPDKALATVQQVKKLVFKP